jgi:hypothetical protein
MGFSLIFLLKEVIIINFFKNELSYNFVKKKLLYLKENGFLENYILFETPAFAQQFEDQYYKSWQDNLSDEQRTSIECYAGNLYKSINDYLKNQDPLYSFAEKYIVSIDNALNNSIIPENVILFRWLNFNSINIDQKNLIKNKYITEKGYSSTNLIPLKPENYNYNLLLIIKAPKGKKGAVINNISRRTHVNEYELLLPRNQTFEIIKVVYLKKNKCILLCNLC